MPALTAFSLRTAGLATASVIAFAANSLLCRIALHSTPIDAASFTSIRLVSGAAILSLVLARRRSGGTPAGNWTSAIALFAYASAFSFAYVQLPAGVGTLILFASVQSTMIGYGLFRGERLGPWQMLGLGSTAAGLIWLLLPGLAAPPAVGAALIASAGVAWGIYSLRGRGATDAAAETTGNFRRTVPLALVLSATMFASHSWPIAGVGYAVLSGAVTSGLGYIIWYSVLPRMAATTAAIIQLAVPVIAAVGGVLVLGEPTSLRLLGSSVAMLGGVALVLATRK